jgi:hypothetical protein
LPAYKRWRISERRKLSNDMGRIRECPIYGFVERFTTEHTVLFEYAHLHCDEHAAQAQVSRRSLFKSSPGTRGTLVLADSARGCALRDLYTCHPTPRASGIVMAGSARVIPVRDCGEQVTGPAF